MKWFMLLNLAVLASCAVEAGNPSTKKPTGTVSIQFAQTEDNEEQSFQLTIDSIELASDTSDIASLSPDVSEIELFSYSSKEDVQAVKSQEVPVGTYAKIYIRLNDKKPPIYRRDGKQMTVEIDHLEERSFYFAEEVEVLEGQETRVLVSLDPRRSLIASKDRPDKMVFEPMGGAFPKPRDSQHEGTAPATDFVQVCAYAYNMIPPLVSTFPPGENHAPHPFIKLDSGSPSPNRDGRPGSAARLPKVFDSKEAVVKDENMECENAFARAPVMNQKYMFRHLPPGAYSLRFFKSNGTYQDAAEDISVTMGK